jgi:hypothetical protein
MIRRNGSGLSKKASQKDSFEGVFFPFKYENNEI